MLLNPDTFPPGICPEIFWVRMRGRVFQGCGASRPTPLEGIYPLTGKPRHVVVENFR